MMRGAYMPMNAGCVLPIARLGRLGWFVEGRTADGHTWTMQPRGGGMTLSEEKRIAVICAAALRAAARVAPLLSSEAAALAPPSASEGPARGMQP